MKVVYQNNTRNEYISRINKVFDYIEANLEKQFTLAELAGVANFSKYHFHRVFFGMVGETPFGFINRVRLERAAIILRDNPSETIAAVAIKTGFTDTSIFSRNFKNQFGVPATEYRRLKKSNLSKINSNYKQQLSSTSMYFCRRTKKLKWRTNMDLNKGVEIQDISPMTLAYIRHTGPYMGDEKLFKELWNRLYTWAGPRRLLEQPDMKSLVIYHDDPSVVPDEKLRLSVCIPVPPDTKVDGEVGKMNLEGGQYMVASFELKPHQFQEAWTWIFGHWFPESGYQPADGQPFEMYSREPEDGTCFVDICIPVKPL